MKLLFLLLIIIMFYIWNNNVRENLHDKKRDVHNKMQWGSHPPISSHLPHVVLLNGPWKTAPISNLVMF